MLYTGFCRKQDFVGELTSVIQNDGNFNLVSSNTQVDFSDASGSSDGFVFRSNYVGTGDNITFAFKDFRCGQSETLSEIKITYGKRYTPSPLPNTNGEWEERQPWKSFYITRQGALSHDTNIKYWIDIEPHRIIIMTQKDHYGYEEPAVLYIGYPEPSTQVQTYLMDNIILAGTNITPFAGNAHGRVEVLKNHDGLMFRNQNLSALLPATNPNIAGEYQLSPIYVGDNTTGFIGKLDGLWILPDTNINHNDEIEIDGARYKVFNCVVRHGYTSFNSISNMLALKVV